MVTVSGIPFFSVRGGARLPGMHLELMNRGNVRGLASRQTGIRGVPWQVTLKKDVLDGAAVKAERTAQSALQGAFITLPLDTGESYSNVLVMFVDILEAMPMREGQGGLLADGTAQYWLESRWDVIIPS